MNAYGVQVVIRLLPDQWPLLRRVRLARLKELYGEEHPAYRREAGVDERSWRVLIATDPHFVCNLHSIPAGLICLRLESVQTARVSYIWVTPRYRGTGVGKGLLLAATDWADRSGMGEMVVTVAWDDTTAIGWYQHAGFSEQGGDEATGSRHLVLRLPSER